MVKRLLIIIIKIKKILKIKIFVKNYLLIILKIDLIVKEKKLLILSILMLMEYLEKILGKMKEKEVEKNIIMVII